MHTQSMHGKNYAVREVGISDSLNGIRWRGVLLYLVLFFPIAFAVIASLYVLWYLCHLALPVPIEDVEDALPFV